MSLFDQFWDTLIQLGLVHRNTKILFFGRSGAGITTLLHMLKTERFVALQSTFMPTWEELNIGNMKVSTYDLGGHERARRLWPDYFPGAHAIVYVVDSADSEQLPECKADLDIMLAAPELLNVPFLILGNKVDNPAAASEAELRTHLGLHQTTGKAGNPHQGIRPIELFMCSVVRREGYEDGFRWLSKYV
ncbi:ADP-ribosylation factor family-domain-containing protein [Mycena latifolia]|nr:ADP-ribosylation factor family-domain-containing protein [Mycena latifolia]